MPNHLHGIVILQGLPAGPLLSNVIGSFKSAASRECRKEGLDTFRWQSRFYDRIIHNEDSIGAVRHYIQMNPVNWAEDEFFMAA
jgi:REP element-mobilizing transposase RayT